MRRAATIAATVAGALVLSLSLPGCDDLGAALDPDPTLPGGATPTSPATPVPPRSGRALLGVDGDARANLVFGELTEPAVYAGGEGPLSLVWRTATYDLFTLGGDIRLGTQPTSTTLRLQLAVDLGRGVVAFASDDGSCTVTVGRAERRSIAGEVSCAGLTDAEGRFTIDVSGTFEAGGGDG
jgi:hypothetical protein